METLALDEGQEVGIENAGVKRKHAVRVPRVVKHELVLRPGGSLGEMTSCSKAPRPASRSVQDYNAGRTTQVPTGRLVGVLRRVRRQIGYKEITLSFERVGPALR